MHSHSYAKKESNFAFKILYSNSVLILNGPSNYQSEFRSIFNFAYHCWNCTLRGGFGFSLYLASINILCYKQNQQKRNKASPSTKAAANMKEKLKPKIQK